MKIKTNLISTIFRYSLKLIIILLMLTIISAIALMAYYVYEHQGREMLVVENANYKVKIFYYQSGFGTINYIRIYSYTKEKWFSEDLLVEADGLDSATVSFIDSSTVKLILLDKFSRLTPPSWYWHVRDSIRVDLLEPNQAK